jgi:hypothetical protein
MLTVTKLHPVHEILAGNAEAENALNCNILEVMVVIYRGQVVTVRTPPCCQDQFADDDDWIFADIRHAYSCGIAAQDLYSAALKTQDHDAAMATLDPAPAGWTHWSDLKPGDVASSGDHHGSVLVVGTPGLFLDSLGTPCAAAWCIGEARTMSDRLQASTSTAVPGVSPFKFNAAQPPPMPFVRLEAGSLTPAQLRHVAEAVAAGEHGIAYIVEHLPGGEG